MDILRNIMNNDLRKQVEQLICTADNPVNHIDELLDLIQSENNKAVRRSLQTLKSAKSFASKYNGEYVLTKYIDDLLSELPNE